MRTTMLTQLHPEPSLFRARNRRRAMTMVELMVSVPISFIFAVLTITVLTTAGIIFANITAETRFRELGARTLERIASQVRTAPTVNIATDYLTAPTAGTTFGSCIYITDLRDGANPIRVAYYLDTVAGDFNTRLMFDPDTTSAPNPANDRVITNRILNFEARRIASGSGEIRIGLTGDIRGTKFAGSTTGEGTRLNLQTTVIPRQR